MSVCFFFFFIVLGSRRRNWGGRRREGARACEERCDDGVQRTRKKNEFVTSPLLSPVLTFFSLNPQSFTNTGTTMRGCAGGSWKVRFGAGERERTRHWGEEGSTFSFFLRRRPHVAVRLDLVSSPHLPSRAPPLLEAFPAEWEQKRCVLCSRAKKKRKRALESCLRQRCAVPNCEPGRGQSFFSSLAGEQQEIKSSPLYSPPPP